MQDTLIGQSPAILSVLDQVSKLASIQRPVLITGERGTGKELIAQRLHYLSPRWEHPFISLNCAALAEGLIDSELFGHEAGAFTGASHRHLGRFEQAEGGSLFLDELGSAPLTVQEKLLRIVEYRRYERVGGSATLTADVRLICATNENLAEKADNHAFRSDLLDRLAFDVIALPPLRERPEDIPLLAEHFAIAMCQELKRPLFPGFSLRVRNTLIHYDWPGNIRQLKNAVERAVYRHDSDSHPIDQVILDPFRPNRPSLEPSENSVAPLTQEISFPINLRQWMETQEHNLLIAGLEKNHYNQKKTAQMLGLSYHQLRGLIKKYQISTKNSI